MEIAAIKWKSRGISKKKVRNLASGEGSFEWETGFEPSSGSAIGNEAGAKVGETLDLDPEGRTRLPVTYSRN
jgi:hypothetical protein